MENDIIKRLEEFIIKIRWKPKFHLTREVRLYEDLGIYGDDAVEFLLAYSKEFNVNVSNFMAADYFKGEGIDIIGSIIKLITGKPSVSNKKILTIGHLEKGVIAGRLDEEIVNS